MFELSIEQYTTITKQPCYYCGVEIGTKSGGLDRKDNSVGYTLENVLPCCRDCNRVRNNVLTVEEMKFVSECLKEFRTNGGKVKVVKE
jgi:hypothetical protein